MEIGPRLAQANGVNARASGRYATMQAAVTRLKYLPGCKSAREENGAKSGIEPGAQQKTAAARSDSVSNCHKNHIGPFGQNGSASKCCRYARTPGSVAP